jgi:hypothetical protein
MPKDIDMLQPILDRRRILEGENQSTAAFPPRPLEILDLRHLEKQVREPIIPAAEALDADATIRAEPMMSSRRLNTDIQTLTGVTGMKVDNGRVRFSRVSRLRVTGNRPIDLLNRFFDSRIDTLLVDGRTAQLLNIQGGTAHLPRSGPQPRIQRLRTCRSRQVEVVVADYHAFGSNGVRTAHS